MKKRRSRVQGKRKEKGKGKDKEKEEDNVASLIYHEGAQARWVFG